MGKNIILFGQYRGFTNAENITLLKDSPIYKHIPAEAVVEITFEDGDIKDCAPSYDYLTVIIRNLSPLSDFGKNFLQKEVFTEENFTNRLIESINFYSLDICYIGFLSGWLEESLSINDKTGKIRFIRSGPQHNSGSGTYSLLYLTSLSNTSKDLKEIFFSFNLEERYERGNHKFCIINDIVYLQREIRLTDDIGFSICEVDKVTVEYTRSKKNIKITGYNNCINTDLFLVDMKWTESKLDKSIYHKVKICQTPTIYLNNISLE